MQVNRRNRIPTSVRAKLPFMVAAFASFVLSILLYFVFEERTAGIFVGLWVPSIHSLGTLMLTTVDGNVARKVEEVTS